MTFALELGRYAGECGVTVRMTDRCHGSRETHPTDDVPLAVTHREDVFAVDIGTDAGLHMVEAVRFPHFSLPDVGDQREVSASVQAMGSVLPSGDRDPCFSLSLPLNPLACPFMGLSNFPLSSGQLSLLDDGLPFLRRFLVPERRPTDNDGAANDEYGDGARPKEHAACNQVAVAVA